jgi:Zn-dependent protease with chaperone function
LTLAIHATALGGGLSHLIGACVLRLRETYGTPGGATVAALGLTLAGAVAARTVLTAMTHLRSAGQQALLHAETARLVGRPEPSLGAVLVEHSDPVAYCVSGRHPTVILSTGAVQALEPAQLSAVLAHERAHLTGRHHRLLAMARIGRLVLPFLPLMRDADAQVARLVEMHADDAAARASDPRSLATALVVLATGASPAPGLAASATDSVARIHRLLRPAEPLSAGRRQLLRATAASLALTPVLLALAPAMLALALGRVA